MRKIPVHISWQSGQVILLVVLVMVVALTVGLSLVARSIINLKNTTDEASSQKAFAAAESGIEQAAKLPQAQSGVFFANEKLNNNDSSTMIKQVQVQILQDSRININDGEPVLQDDGTDLWLTNYPDYSGSPWTGKVYVYFGTNGTCSDPAMEIIIISGSGPNPKTNATITRYGVEAVNGLASACSGRPGQNNFPLASPGGAFNGRIYKSVIALQVTNGLLIRIIPLYSGTPIGVWGRNAGDTLDQPFPPQGRIITSVGVSGTTKRKISFFQGYNSIPSEYFYSLFTQR